MSLASPYQEHYYVADGVTTSFSFGEYFTGLSQAYVKSVIYFDDGTNCVPTFTVDMTTGFITIVTLTKPDGTVLTVPPAGSIVRVFRDTPEQQNVTASQLQNYTAKQLERIFDSVVAMIQEVSYSDLHKTIRLTETQRDVSVEQLTEEKDQGILYWDFESRTLKATDYGQDEVVKSETVDRLLYLQPEGKIYFIPKGSTTPISIGSVSLHNDLGGRNAPDCHPESAITGLREHLQELRDKDIEIEEDVQTALNRSQEAKDTADEAKETAEYAQTIAGQAKDIAEDAKETAEGIEDIAQEAKDTADEAKEIAQDAKDIAEGVVEDIEAVEEGLANHIADKANPHEVTKAQVGLGNVDNTSDLNKPISTATQNALDLKADKATTYTKTETDTLLGAKQDTISDLSTIRSNAQAGKAASDTIATYGDIVTHDVAEFATAAQGAKADTALQAGDNVSELVNDAGYLVMGDLTNFVTKNTAQTISGLKTFTGDITLSGTTSIKNTTNGVSYTMLYRDASGIHVGTSTQALLLAGSNARPKFNNNDIAMLSDIPTAVSQLTNDTGFITNAVNDLQNYTLTSDLATVATSGSYNDLSDKPTIPTVDQTYDATSANAQSGIAINNAKFLRNTATNTESLTIYGDASFRRNTINIGAHSSPTGVNSVMIGAYSQAGEGAFAIGNGATAGNYSLGLLGSATANYAYQIGRGTNTETNSLYVGWTSTGNYKLLGSDGLIPDARISSNITRTSDLATVATSGSYTDLSDKPTIPTVGDGTITITQGGVIKGTFTTNQSGNTTIALESGGGGGSVDIDNTTITENASQEIQAVAVIDQNTGIAKTWTGTMAEYDAIVTKDPETEYIITDDIGGSATEIGQITEALNNKVDKGHQVIAFQAPTAANNYTWYRKYADGWVEQGGLWTNPSASSSNYTQTLLIKMADNKYQTSVTVYTETPSTSYYAPKASNRTTTTFVITANASQVMWQVSGMAA